MVEPVPFADILVGELHNVFWKINCTAPLSASASVRAAQLLSYAFAVEEEKE